MLLYSRFSSISQFAGVKMKKIIINTHRRSHVHRSYRRTVFLFKFNEVRLCIVSYYSVKIAFISCNFTYTLCVHSTKIHLQRFLFKKNTIKKERIAFNELEKSRSERIVIMNLKLRFTSVKVYLFINRALRNKNQIILVNNNRIYQRFFFQMQTKSHDTEYILIDKVYE